MKSEAPNLRVKITKDVIADASPANPHQCMIAQALRQQHGASSLVVTAEGARFNIGSVRYYYELPLKARDGLLKFDKNKSSVTPFTFTLRGEAGFTRPVIKQPPRQKSKHKKKRSKRKLKVCKRRFHGLQVPVAA
jgi:hypothetical protein